MNDRFGDRLGFLSSEEFESRLRSISPHTASRRSSRSPRPPIQNNDNILSFSHSSHPTIAAWPAPPPKPDLVSTHQKLQLSSSPHSPRSIHSPQPPNESSNDLFHEQSLLSMLKAAAGGGSANGAPRIRETELKRKIQTLEDTVAEYERQKYNVMGTFSEYKERVAERERKLEAEYSTKILSLSEEVLGAKKDFEARMKSFQALQDKFEREKETALEKLRQEHQKEIQLLEQRFSESQLLNLEQKYILEIRRLEEERKSLRSEKERLGETFEMKLRRAQSLYETELGAAKMLYAKELEALRDHEHALKAELAARQDEFNDRLNELQNQAKSSRDELKSWRNEVASLQRKLRSKEEEIEEINNDLDDARREMKSAMAKVNSLAGEMGGEKKEKEEIMRELEEKRELLSSVESAREQCESVIKDLKENVKALKNKVDFLEKERLNLQSESESQEHVHESQVKALEAVLEGVSKEKEGVKENFEKSLQKEKQQSEAREHAMKKEFSIKLNELEEQYNALKEDLEHSAKQDRDELRESTAREMESLKVEKGLLEAQVSALLTRLGEEEDTGDADDKLQTICKESDELRRQLDDFRERLQHKEGEVHELKQHLHQENQIAADQLMVIRDEIRLELLGSDEFSVANKQQEKLQQKIVELEMLQEKEDEKNKKKIRDLEASNEKLRKQLKSESDSKADDLEGKMKQLQDNFEEEVRKAVLKELASRKAEDKDKETCSLLSQIEELTCSNEEKSVQLEDLKDRVQSLLGEVNEMKGELDKKTKEFEVFVDKIDKNSGDNSIEQEKIIKEMRVEREQLIERIREMERVQTEREEADTQSEDELEVPAEKAVVISVHSMDCQTDPLPDPPVQAIVDLAREKELKNKIEELERQLQEKEDMICELQSQGQTSSGDSSEEREKERSPTSRGKSPSMHRLRERSPGKGMGSSRNLLCPSDAERRERRGSPSASLLGRNKKEEAKKPAWKF